MSTAQVHLPEPTNREYRGLPKWLRKGDVTRCVSCGEPWPCSSARSGASFRSSGVGEPSAAKGQTGRQACAPRGEARDGLTRRPVATPTTDPGNSAASSELLSELKDPAFVGHSGNIYVLGNVGLLICDATRNTIAFVNAWEAMQLADQIAAAYQERRRSP